MTISSMEIQSMMKVHYVPRGFWDHEPPSLTLGCQRLRPVAPKPPANTVAADSPATTTATFDLKSFIRPESGGPIKFGSSDYEKKELAQVEATQPGGTRWNPTQEQIGILEMLYRNGMRTPNAQQIEQITVQLRKYGKIEGKNVFYWFQNHKARERQKQKRTSLGFSHSPMRTPSPFSSVTSLLLSPSKEELLDNIPYKRKCRPWAFDRSLDEDNKCCKEEGQDRTLELFPLHPEGRS